MEWIEILDGWMDGWTDWLGSRLFKIQNYTIIGNLKCKETEKAICFTDWHIHQTEKVFEHFVFIQCETINHVIALFFFLLFNIDRPENDSFQNVHLLLHRFRFSEHFNFNGNGFRLQFRGESLTSHKKISIIFLSFHEPDWFRSQYPRLWNNIFDLQNFSLEMCFFPPHKHL